MNPRLLVKTTAGKVERQQEGAIRLSKSDEPSKQKIPVTLSAASSDEIGTSGGEGCAAREQLMPSPIANRLKLPELELIKYLSL